MKAKKIIVLILAVAVILPVPVSTSRADTEFFRFPATMVKALYTSDSKGLDGFLADEKTRALVTICAFFDWQAYDNSADFLLSYSYIGKDKEGNILWVGLGGRETSIVLMYAPDSDPDNFVGIPFEFSGSWIPSFIDLYCDPLYHNEKETIETVVRNLNDRT